MAKYKYAYLFAILSRAACLFVALFYLNTLYLNDIIMFRCLVEYITFIALYYMNPGFRRFYYFNKFSSRAANKPRGCDIIANNNNLVGIPTFQICVFFRKTVPVPMAGTEYFRNMNIRSFIFLETHPQ